jgi:hypothetical protein
MFGGSCASTTRTFPLESGEVQPGADQLLDEAAGQRIVDRDVDGALRRAVVIGDFREVGEHGSAVGVVADACRMRCLTVSMVSRCGEGPRR